MNRCIAPFSVVLWLVSMGCDDHLFPNPHEDTTVSGEGWCAVQQVVSGGCLGCHSAGLALGGLDLETDPHGALVGVTSAAYGVPLVLPGDPAGSLFYTKLAGTQAGGQGGSMPPSAAVEPATLTVIEAWIAAGADAECADVPPPPGREHPVGWSAPEVHGMAAKFQERDCRTCHGTELDGNLGPACSTCHPSDWKTTCTYCHGDVDSTTGAPPEDIDDNVDPANSPYRPHTEHLSPGDHAPIACETCHTVPTSALSVGHLFTDGSPGRAEVTFSGLASGGAWTGQACTVYCHGSGRAPGTLEHTDGPRDCASCHPSQDTVTRWSTMGGEHREHLREGFQCQECHGTVAGSTGTIVGPDLHVNGSVEVALPAGITRVGNNCTGVCHGENHAAESW